MHRKMVLAAALVALAAGAKDLNAQLPGPNLQLTPKIGAYVPVNELAVVSNAVAGNNPAELGGSLAIGLALELDLPLFPIDLRANLDYATDTRLSVGDDAGDPQEAAATLLALSGDLVFRPVPAIAPLQPYLLAGAGIKRYDFDEEDLEEGQIEDIFADKSNFAFHVGAGLNVRLLPSVSLLVEVTDYISRYKPESAAAGDDSKLQNDIFGMVGLRVGLF